MKFWSSSQSGSNVGTWPVVQREFRAASHRASSYWQRVIAAGVAFLIFFSLSQSNFSTPPALGTHLFIRIHLLLLALLILMVPFMTADCIAKEKREGTLGLLFLTPLTSKEIIVGKSLVQALRAFSIWLAILPILTLPFSMGGIIWRDMFISVMTEMTVAILALSSGLLASTLTEDRNFALFYSYSFTGLLLAGFCIFIGILSVLFETSQSSFTPDIWDFGQFGLTKILCFFPGKWQIFPSFWVTIRATSWVNEIAICLIVSLIIFLVTLWIAARHVRNTWNDESFKKNKWWQPLNVSYSFFHNKKKANSNVFVSTHRLARTLRILATSLFLIVYFTTWGCGLDIKYSTVFFTTFTLSLFFLILLFNLTSSNFIIAISASEMEAVRMRNPVALLRFGVKYVATVVFGSKRLLDQNPITWLQHYSAKNRLIKWGLFILFVLLDSLFYLHAPSPNSGINKDLIEQLMLIILGIMYTLAGVNSFWREKQNGGLELLLVTPLSAGQIIRGRARGLWSQFLPALIVLALFHFTGSEQRGALDFISVWTIFCTYISLPFFAIYTALRVKYFIVALIITFFGVFFSCIFGSIVVTDMDVLVSLTVELRTLSAILGITVGYAIFVGVTFFLLKHCLSRRIYSF